MLLGGTIAGTYRNAAEWEALLAKSRFRAVTAPFNCRTPDPEVKEYMDAAARCGAAVAEVGVWKNLFDPDPVLAAQNQAYAREQLALADRWGIPCCVNVAGTPGAAGWDAADPVNFSPDMYDRIVSCIRSILDDVRPKRAYYTLEPMPWMIPDSPDCCLQLIRDVDRKQFAAHMDFVNMINCPRRFLAYEAFVEECFSKLGPYIKSTHLKDIRLDPMKLTTHLKECSPGEGSLDFCAILRIMHKYLPSDAPVLLEHMQTYEEYENAYRTVRACADAAGIPV